MADMKKLIGLIKSVESQVSRCTRCGICQAVCPVYGVSGNEADVARGKLALIDGATRHLFDDPAGIYDRLNRCLLCGKCAAECPRGVETIDIYLKVRAMLAEYTGMPLVQKMIFRRMLSNPGALDRIARWGARWQHLFARSTDREVIPGTGPLVSPLLLNRYVPSLAARPFHLTAADTKIMDGDITVALFVGCLIDKVFPQIAHAMMDIFHHHHVRVVIPPQQGCCGIPALSAGDMVTFRKLVAHHLTRFDPDRFDYLVSGCSTCTAVIKSMWPAMYGPEMDGHDRLRLARISEKTIDFSKLIVNSIGVDPFLTAAAAMPAPEARVTYHDPCHLKNLLKSCDEPRTLISMNPRYEYVEMPDADLCCGMGGGFGLSHPDVSHQIGQRKIERILQTGADVVGTGCPACMIQLAELCYRTGRPVAVRHTAEIYAESLK